MNSKEKYEVQYGEQGGKCCKKWKQEGEQKVEDKSGEVKGIEGKQEFVRPIGANHGFCGGFGGHRGLGFGGPFGGPFGGHHGKHHMKKMLFLQQLALNTPPAALNEES
ncbi:MAG: hypothetical protein EZS28_036137, partial [Streblomastix strix]